MDGERSDGYPTLFFSVSGDDYFLNIDKHMFNITFLNKAGATLFCRGIVEG
jgi:hypothetical protein